MVCFLQFRRNWHATALSLAFLPMAPLAVLGQRSQSAPADQKTDQNASGQNPDGVERQDSRGASSKPLPLRPAVPGTGRNLRLILKDGSYQMVRDYQIVGDRVRYLSQERGEWEELPRDLIDWDATNKWSREHDELADENSSPAMKEAAEIDAEELQVRRDNQARMPQVAPGVELPDEEGVYVLDTYHGTPELVELRATDLSLNTKNRKGVEVLNPLASQKANLELEGANARVHLHVDDPAIYLSLGVEDQTEPALTHPMTIDTGGAKAVNSGKHGAHSPQSGFVIVRVDERQAVRVVGVIHKSPTGPVTQDEDTILTKAEVLPGKHWLKIEPEQTLSIGEYALVEILSSSDISESVWDFRVDPRLGENAGAIGPILGSGNR
jgi:hypothetical protein